ncbi:MAG: hypothetical protein R3B09_06035 [Nannocystaceae bacterium]
MSFAGEDDMISGNDGCGCRRVDFVVSSSTSTSSDSSSGDMTTSTDVTTSDDETASGGSSTTSTGSTTDLTTTTGLDTEPLSSTSPSTDTDTTTGAPIEVRRVFLSSESYHGDLDPMDGDPLGLELADQHCQSLAEDVGLGGVYMAWLSDSSVGPAERFGMDDFAGELRLVDETIVAIGWDELTTGPLRHAITVTETEERLGFDALPAVVVVWTNTDTAGHSAGSINCTDWSADTIDAPGRLGRAKDGLTTAEWTLDMWDGLCGNIGHLYCVQVFE